jgi:hypothetical protein
LISDFGLAHNAAPSVTSVGSAPGFSTIVIGTGTCPDWALTNRSTVKRSV